MLLELKGVITQDSVAIVTNAIKSGERLEIHVDSPGGDLFAGLSIFNMLEQYEPGIDIFIDGVSGSIASIISLAGTKRPTISENGSFMIHNAQVENIEGNQHKLRSVADSLEKYSDIVAKIYQVKTGQSKEIIANAMDKETVFNSADSLEFGLAGDIFNPIRAVALINKIDMNLLDRIKNNLTTPIEPVAPVNVEPGQEPTEPTEPGAEGFTPEQLEEISVIVGEMIAEALAGQTETLEANIGNTIATVFNEIRSTGTPPKKAGINAPTDPMQGADPGITAFYAKMKDIKNQNK